MPSIRHKTSGRRARDAVVLDAARDVVLAIGVRHMTLTEVARKAGVSRMTIYRRWPDVQSVVADLMTREWASLIEAVLPVDPHAGARTKIVTGLVTGVRELRAHPLFRKIIEVDPEVMLPYVFQRRGATQDAILAALEQSVRAGHAEGTVRIDHPTRQARTLLLIAQSFALSGQTMEADDSALSSGAFEQELRTVLERFLQP